MLPIGSCGERAAFFCPGTASTFELSTEEEMEAALQAKIVHLGGTGLLTKLDGAPSLQILQRAKQLGRTTVFDLILANTKTVALVEPLLPLIDYFVPSIEEAAALAGCEGSREAPLIAKFFKDHGVQNVILTMDRDGVYVDPKHAPPPFLSRPTRLTWSTRRVVGYIRPRVEKVDSFMRSKS